MCSSLPIPRMIWSSVGHIRSGGGDCRCGWRTRDPRRPTCDLRKYPSLSSQTPLPSMCRRLTGFFCSLLHWEPKARRKGRRHMQGDALPQQWFCPYPGTCVGPPRHTSLSLLAFGHYHCPTGKQPTAPAGGWAPADRPDSSLSQCIVCVV
jgi:hypothetical protein